MLNRWKGEAIDCISNGCLTFVGRQVIFASYAAQAWSNRVIRVKPHHPQEGGVQPQQLDS